MWIAMLRTLVRLALSAVVASAAYGQAGLPGTGGGADAGAGTVIGDDDGADDGSGDDVDDGDDGNDGGDDGTGDVIGRPKTGQARFTIAYVARDPFTGFERELRIGPTGRAELRERAPAADALPVAPIGRVARARLEPEEVAGLEAVLAELFARPLAPSALAGADGVDRRVALDVRGELEERRANGEDALTKEAVAWLEELALMVESGVLDERRQLLAAKLARPDRGAHSASVLIVPRVEPKVIRYELDSRGRRHVTRVRALDAAGMEEVRALVALLPPAVARPLTFSAASAPAPAPPIRVILGRLLVP